ncbi:MAG: NADH-quinone oxidoreductase subunit NuoG [Parachlamydiaceae bacterium]
MVNLTIDHQCITVPQGTTVYQASKQLGIEIPIFCYLDRLPPFGACRVCMVEVDKMSKPQTSCTLEAKEGMVVRTQSAMASEARKEMIEFLLLNHPLDCPICDRGGECPLQENALRYGPGLSRFFEEKRHFKKGVPLGPVLMLDRERCIVCARCTRFSDLISGDHALEFIERGYKTEVGTPGGRAAESKFIGNTIMICPVGALTSQVYRFRARPWDNDSTESSCTLCPVGCSMMLDSRDGEIMRTRSRENRDLNDIWLCDKGWFGYEFAYSAERLMHPLIRRNGLLEPASWDEALSLVATTIELKKKEGKIAGFGGNPLTFEENDLFQQLMRKGAGTPHLDHRIGMPLLTIEEEGICPGMEIMIKECEELAFAALIGLDLTEEFPLIWLRLRQAINKGAHVAFMGHFSPEISPYLSQTTLHRPGEELQTLKKQLPSLIEMAKQGKKGAFFIGSQYLRSPDRRAILSLLLQWRQDYPSISLNSMEGRGNSLGARLAGLRPDAGPFAEPLPYCGMNAAQVLETGAKEGWGMLYVVGANPALKFPSMLWERARSKTEFLVVQDLFLTETAREADVVLPSLNFLEKTGSFVNIEGRIQSLNPGKEIPQGLYSDGDIFKEIGKKLTPPLGFNPLPLARLRSDLVFLKKHPFVERGERVEKKEEEEEGSEGRFLLASFSHSLFDCGVRMNHNLHLRKLVKQPMFRLSAKEGERQGIREGQRVRLGANGRFLDGDVQFDEQVVDGVVVIPMGFEKEMPIYELGFPLMNGLKVHIFPIPENEHAFNPAFFPGPK